ncbi:MAG: OmpA family protein [Thermodesulfobacteriota bacterium]|nr:MAG: OmpA family protein [Thermodesulfobacteriota bacterium]
MSEDGQIDPNSWMITFADLVMLLLTFFVLLLTMSSMDTKKLRNLMTHFRASTGVLEFSGAGRVNHLGGFINRYNDTESLLVVDQKHFLTQIKVVSNIKNMLKDFSNNITLSDDERGVALTFHGNILFDPGKTTLKKEAYPDLDVIADAIEECPNDILIMGHSDNTPTKGELYKSNWELSVYRGISVLDYFLKKKGLSSSRFSVGGSGASSPLYPNTSQKNRSLNRRVEIIFKHLEEI